jgi:hypothetical protein
VGSSDVNTQCERTVTARSLIQRVADDHALDVGEMVAATGRSAQFLAGARDMLHRAFPPDAFPGVDVLVIGSIAKRQCTPGSDLDFFGVMDAGVTVEQTQPLVQALLDYARAQGFDAPFAAGPFAGFVPRAELETFDLLNNTPRHITRRTTLLAGSVSIYRPELRSEVVRRTLSTLVGREREPRPRGVIDHLLLMSRLNPFSVELRIPDTKSSDGGFVQWAKVGTLYLIEHAGALAAIIRADLATRGRPRDELIAAIGQHLDQPPLERLLAWYDDVSPAGQQALATTVSVTNAVLRLLGTNGVRPMLVAKADDEPTRELHRTFSTHMKALRRAIVQLFFREDAFRPWTEEHGLFG